MLATGIRDRIKLYRKFINQEDSEELINFFGKKKLPSVLGEAEFIDWVRRTFFTDKTDNQVPDLRHFAPEIERITRSRSLRKSPLVTDIFNTSS